MKEFSTWKDDVLSFVAFLSFFDKCSCCIFHLCAVLSKGESNQTTFKLYFEPSETANILADQRLLDQLS